ncbi:MFS transporter [Nocardioidaceae bacterium]|nr:MFS transporter [Nocardioidaceae bacterium]
MSLTRPRHVTREERLAKAAPDAEGHFSHRQVLTIVSGLMVGMFLAALDQTVVSTAIRTIADDLQGYDLQAWATTAFLITSTISTPLYGKLSDLYGRRPFYLAAITIFVIGSALCGIAGSMYELAVFRAVQGIGAGGLMSLALAIIADVVAPRERARYQGYFMAVFGTSSVLGPVIGGFLAGQASIVGLAGWRWIFWINVPLGLLAFVVVSRVLYLPAVRRAEHRIDWPGALAMITFLVPVLVVAEQGRTWGWLSAAAVTSYVIAAVGLAAFVRIELGYGADALLPLALFRNRTFAVGALSSIIIGMGMFGALLLLPQYLQVVKGSTPTVAGLQTIPLVLGIMTASLISGQFIARTGTYRPLPIGGVVLVGGGLTAMALVVEPSTSWWLLAPMMLAVGLGLGFNFQPMVLAVQNAVDPRQIGVATSSVTSFRQLGGTLGAAAFFSVLFTRLPGDISSEVGAASQADPALAPRLQEVAGRATDLSDTSFLQQLPDGVAAPFLAGFTDSLTFVFGIAAALMILALVVLVRLPALELRSGSASQARQAAESEQSTSEGDPVAELGDPAGTVEDAPDEPLEDAEARRGQVAAGGPNA